MPARKKKGKGKKKAKRVAPRQKKVSKVEALPPEQPPVTAEEDVEESLDKKDTPVEDVFLDDEGEPEKNPEISGIEEEHASKPQNEMEEEEEEEAAQDDMDEGEDEDDEEEESSDGEIVPFIKGIAMRSRRGTRMEYLKATGKLEEEEDDFWKENKYFGKLDELDKEDEDNEYEEEKSEPDVFDPDFNATDEEENANEEEKEDEKKMKEKDEDFELRPKRKKNQLESILEKRKKMMQREKDEIRKMRAPVTAEMKKGIKAGHARNLSDRTLREYDSQEGKVLEIVYTKSDSDDRKQEGNASHIFVEIEEKGEKHDEARVDANKAVRKPKFIHNFMTQEQLLKQAAWNEVLNQQSLENLIKLEEEKKKYKGSAKSRPQPPLVKHIFKHDKESGSLKIDVYVDDHETFLKTFSFAANAPQVGGPNMIAPTGEQPEINIPRKKWKYRDPDTKEGFDNVLEYKRLQIKEMKARKKVIKHQLKLLRDLLEKKQEIIDKLH